MLNALRYNPEILATTARQVVLQASDIMHKVKAKIQQARNNKLSTELLRVETVNEVFDYIKKVADAKGMELLKKTLTYTKRNNHISIYQMKMC
jgi:hypothetical protein